MKKYIPLDSGPNVRRITSFGCYSCCDESRSDTIGDEKFSASTATKMMRTDAVGWSGNPCAQARSEYLCKLRPSRWSGGSCMDESLDQPGDTSIGDKIAAGYLGILAEGQTPLQAMDANGAISSPESGFEPQGVSLYPRCRNRAVGNARVELATHRLLVCCSTN